MHAVSLLSQCLSFHSSSQKRKKNSPPHHSVLRQRDLTTMKRQDPFFTSSSRRETSPEKNVASKRIGCMSGFLRLVYKYHNSRRFLTLGKKQDKNNTEPSSPTETKQTVTASLSLKQIEKDVEARFSCDVPRSPTLPAEMRRSNSLKTQPSVVARLMGLNEAASAESSVAEKRRKLLGALEKCDEDLKALKKIIEMVKHVGDSKRCHNNYDASGYDRRGKCGVFGETGCNDLQPSPVSVLDEFTRSAFAGYSKRYINGVPQQQKKKPMEGDLFNLNFIDRITNEMIKVKTEDIDMPLWTTKAMVDSLNEVCKDIDWGEKREIGRIGLALQDFIFRGLIEDVVKEMGCAFNIQPLPFESCKRQLPF